MLNPTCSEAVFRLGSKKFRIDTSTSTGIERFIEALATMSDRTLEKYEYLDNEGGGADFDFIEGLIELRLELGKEEFLRLRSVWKKLWWDWAVLVLGRKFHITPSPELLFSALLEEGTSASIVVLRREPRKLRGDLAHQVLDLYREFKEGKARRKGDDDIPSTDEDEKLAKIGSLFQRWKRGEISKSEFRAEGLALLFLEETMGKINRTTFVFCADIDLTEEQIEELEAQIEDEARKRGHKTEDILSWRFRIPVVVTLKKTVPNPTCSEAVFRLGGEMFYVHTDDSDEVESFGEQLKEVEDDEALESYEPLDNRGGGADFYALEKLIKLRKKLGKELFRRVPRERMWDIDEQTVAVVLGKECHIASRPEEFFAALLEEGKEAEAVALSESAEEILRLFRGWKEGKITKEEFRAKALALLLLEERMSPLGIQIGYINLGTKRWLWLDKSIDGKWSLRFVCYGNDILGIAKTTKAARLEADGGTECHAKIALVYQSWDDLIADLKRFLDLKLIELVAPETVFKARQPERARVLAMVLLDTQQLEDETRAKIISKILLEV
jgi:hypothetical protein